MSAMAQTCSRCSRANPAEAAYCYFDGNPLPARAGTGATVPLGRRPFPAPFIFPSGRTCRTFDELVLACHDNWTEACELLGDGRFERFLDSLGRPDLARIAREAARFPDREWGLDQFLVRLPTTGVLEPASLQVEPREVNLGLLTGGEDRVFQVHLINQGMRLLRGSVSSDRVWLSLGDAAGGRQKVFQVRGELVLTVCLRARYVTGGGKPLEGRLLIESNGGSATVVVRAEVHVKPFPEGVLAGAVSPRQLAEKARDRPKEAAIYFENGAVAQWYRANGWTYPIQGPVASGVAAIQQFFEALGLSTAPKVEVSERFIQLVGRPGATIRRQLDVRTDEKRPVYAFADSDQPWLQVERVEPQGRAAAVCLLVPSVPDRPGETLEARLTIRSNGRQGFVIPVVLAVAGTPRPRPGEEPILDVIPVVQPADEPPPRRARRPRKGRPFSLWTALVQGALAALLVLVLGGIICRDALLNARVENDPHPLDPHLRVALQFHDTQEFVLLGADGIKPPDGRQDRGGTEAIWEPSMRFGLVMYNEADSRRKVKRLCFEEKGFTNNVCVRLDGNEWLFGERPFRTLTGRLSGQWPGRWLQPKVPLGKDADGRERDGCKSIWIYDAEKVVITQTAEVVRGEQTGRPDTCLVRYLIENWDTQPHRVGLRFLLDTYIGANDGVPFTIPGEKQLCDTMMVFNGKKSIPDFIQALEREDLKNPGTVAHLQLRVDDKLEMPDRVTLGAYPNPHLDDPRCRQEKTLWDVPVLPMKTLRPPDSAVVIYWNERELKPGQRREMGFTYGLGSVVSGEGNGRLGVTVGGTFRPGGEFTVTAYVSNPMPGERLTLHLPDGFRLVEGQAEQPVPELPAGARRRNSPVTWRVQAGHEGEYTLRVESSAGGGQSRPLVIGRRLGIFD
ncbi:MAG TPA: hypothetical protein VNK04_09275 [Gemmataceae bacterium]|nr:hypothetical protein [Gemmataceae bacterium]